MGISITTRAGKGAPLNATEHDTNLQNIVSAIENTSTGHDHDGIDSKKVIATNLDVTGLTAGRVVRVNSGGTALESGQDLNTTPAANTIPVALSDKKLSEGWTKFGFETYSRLSVGTSFPASNHNVLFWNSNELKLYKYDARTETWTEIDWKTIVKASPEWIAGRLRINSSTGKLEISPDGANWYECIPSVGSNTVELITLDNTNFSYKYWIAPGQTVIVRNANHVPIVYAKDIVPFFSGSWFHTYSYDQWVGLRPSNIAISNGDGQWVAGGGTNVSAGRGTSLSIVPILDQSATNTNWANFELRVMTDNRFYVNSLGQGAGGYFVVATNGSGTASSTSYWLGTWYDQNGSNFTVNNLTLTRRA